MIGHIKIDNEIILVQTKSTGITKTLQLRKMGKPGAYFNYVSEYLTNHRNTLELLRQGVDVYL